MKPATTPSAAPGTEKSGSLRGPAIKFGLLLLLIVGGFLAARYTPLANYLTLEKLRTTLAAVRGVWWAPAALVGVIVVLGSVGVPATPFIIAGAAIFGPLWGTVWNWVGIFLSSLTGFLLARLLGREFVERIGGEKLQRAEKLMHRRGFIPLIAIRFLPVPFTLVNAAAAVAGVKLPKFLAAAAIGLLPPIAILTYFSSALLDAATGDRAKIVRHMLIVSTSAAMIVFLPIGIRRRLRKRRLKQLRALRAARTSNPSA
ncbi:MAG: VTT domain-containing protein [Thermoanaerobaculia bacterium]